MYRQIMSTATNVAILAAFVAVLSGPTSASPKDDFRNSALAERLHRATSDRAQAMSQAPNNYGQEPCAYQYHGGPKSAWTCWSQSQPNHSGAR
jgi:hypothetical protein